MAKATKVKGTKAEKVVVKKSPGRPALYDANIVVKHLKKYEGLPGGLLKAWTSVKALKAFAKISYATMCNIASKNEIKFGLGKPKEVKPPVKVKAKKAKADTVAEVAVAA